MENKVEYCCQAGESCSPADLTSIVEPTFKDTLGGILTHTKSILADCLELIAKIGGPLDGGEDFAGGDPKWCAIKHLKLAAQDNEKKAERLLEALHKLHDEL